MWERTDKSARPAREFAAAHRLDYSASAPSEVVDTSDALPFTGESLHHHVSGPWRGRSVRRFEAGRYTVELMTTSGPLPTLHVIPSGLDYRALALSGRFTATGDAAFDRRWSLITNDEDFAAALLTPGMREALMHPAADGRAISFRGDQVSSWAQGDGSWSEARVRLEFLAVLVGRPARSITLVGAESRGARRRPAVGRGAEARARPCRVESRHLRHRRVRGRLAQRRT